MASGIQQYHSVKEENYDNLIYAKSGFLKLAKIKRTKNSIMQIITPTDVKSLGGYLFFFYFFHNLLMSSKVFPFVSGTHFQTNMAASTHMVPYNP